jgi:hypothetical protein
MSQPVLIRNAYHRVLKLMASQPTEDRTMGGIVEEQLDQLHFFKKRLDDVEKQIKRKKK